MKSRWQVGQKATSPFQPPDHLTHSAKLKLSWDSRLCPYRHVRWPHADSGDWVAETKERGERAYATLTQLMLWRKTLLFLAAPSNPIQLHKRGGPILPVILPVHSQTGYRDNEALCEEYISDSSELCSNEWIRANNNPHWTTTTTHTEQQQPLSYWTTTPKLNNT